MVEIVTSRIELEIDGSKQPLQSLNFAFDRSVDVDGQPTSPTRCTEISFTLESSKNVKLLAWMMDNYGRKSGKIIIHERDSIQELKTFEFTDAYMTHFDESFEEGGAGTVSITISAKEVSLKGDEEVKMTNEWVLASDE